MDEIWPNSSRTDITSDCWVFLSSCPTQSVVLQTKSKVWSAKFCSCVNLIFSFTLTAAGRIADTVCLKMESSLEVIPVQWRNLPLSVWGLMRGSPLCLRSLSFSLSFLSWDPERDLQRDSLDRERRCRDLLDRDEDRDRLLLGDLEHTRDCQTSHLNVAFFWGNALILTFCTVDRKMLKQTVQVIDMHLPDYPPVWISLLPGTWSRPPAVASMSAVTPRIWDFAWICLFGKTNKKLHFQKFWPYDSFHLPKDSESEK